MDFKAIYFLFYKCVLRILSWTCICFILIKILWLSLPEKLLFGDLCSLLQCAFHKLFQSFSLLTPPPPPPPPPFLQSTASSNIDLPPSGQKWLNQVPSRGFNRMNTTTRKKWSVSTCLTPRLLQPKRRVFLLHVSTDHLEILWGSLDTSFKN